MLLSWQKNFEKYIDITGSSELEEKNYFSQPIELDATAFAYYLMQHLHPNINPRSLYVPKYAVDYIKKSRGFYQSFFQVADQNKRYYFNRYSYQNNLELKQLAFLYHQNH
jgi:hypothetical protein